MEQLLLPRINGRNLAYLFIIIPVFQILTFVVTLLDLSIRIVDLARGKAGEAGGSLEAFIHGKVLVLSQLERSFDLVLLMGLLYPCWMKVWCNSMGVLAPLLGLFTWIRAAFDPAC